MAGRPHLSDEGASGQVPTEPAESAKVESQAASDATLPFDDDDDSAVAGVRGNRFARIQNVDFTPVRLALTVGVAFAVALTALCGWLGYRVYEARQQQDQRQLMLQVGKQAAVNLTTIDFEDAEADVQRILGLATGQFYDEFNTRSAPFIEVVKRAQSKSSGTVTEAGLESVNGQEGQVLVAVSVATTSRGAADEQPRYWRMRLTVTKQGEDAKVSKVEFVP
jgi:Mce-associated membrane protein